MKSTVKNLWLSSRDIFISEFTHLLGTEAGKRAFDDSYIDRLRARRSNVERAFWKLTFFNLVLLAALFLNAFVLPADFTVEGFSAHDIGKLKEIILFISASLTFATSLIADELKMLGEMGKAWVTSKYGADVAQYMNLLFASVPGEIPKLFHATKLARVPSGVTKALQIMFIVLVLVTFGVFLLAMFGAYLTVILDVIKRPSLPPVLAWTIVGYAGLAYASQVLVAFFRDVPLPFRDYSMAYELAKLKERSPEKFQDWMRQLGKH